MKKKTMIFLSSLILCCMILTVKASSVTINPINNVYKEGIYQIPKNDNNSYNVSYQFLDKSKKSTIIVLDENYDIQYKNINCNRKCNAGIITNKNTLVIIGDSEAAIEFSKID